MQIRDDLQYPALRLEQGDEALQDGGPSGKGPRHKKKKVHMIVKSHHVLPFTYKLHQGDRDFVPTPLVACPDGPRCPYFHKYREYRSSCVYNHGERVSAESAYVWIR